MLFFRKAHALEPDDPRYSLGLIDALARRRRREELAEKVRQFLERFPSHPERPRVVSAAVDALLELVQREREASQWEEVAALLGRVVALDPSGARGAQAREWLWQADAHLAGIYQRSKQWAQASRALVQLASLRPSSPQEAQRYQQVAGEAIRQMVPDVLLKGIEEELAQGRADEAQALYDALGRMAGGRLPAAAAGLARRIEEARSRAVPGPSPTLAPLSGARQPPETSPADESGDTEGEDSAR
jgi:tetratricopeptide (TPR) repeat protein